jgi:CheY-like chemotaxis protein
LVLRETAVVEEMSSILFLDDDPDRHYLVKEFERDLLQPRAPKARPSKPLDHRVDHAWSAEEAADLIDRRRYDVAFLDYDLDAFAPGAPNGMTVVDYIISVPRPRRPRKVVVHSLNLGTAPARMVAKLQGHVRECVRAPFASVIMVNELCRCVQGS